MNMVKVESSQIGFIGHEGTTLAVAFKNGAVWHYANVTPEQHAALMSAPSVGKHFNANIKGMPDLHPGTPA